ncbi:hypothetical protein [Halomonas sp. BMC6]|uniref:hypothetical protein n=1 Tax=Halomonas sp. BMC6 TaxID=3073244 RepID=UPI0030D483FC
MIAIFKLLEQENLISLAHNYLHSIYFSFPYLPGLFTDEMLIGGLIGLLEDVAALAKLTAASLGNMSATAGGLLGKTEAAPIQADPG